MARETKEQRVERLERELAEETAARVEYLLGVPKRLMDAHALARTLGINVEITLSDTGPVLYFSDENNQFEDRLTYQAEQWELEYVERKLRDLKDKRDAQVARQALAQSLFDKMTPEEKYALKENIHHLR